jgi:hypothetical protein
MSLAHICANYCNFVMNTKLVGTRFQARHYERSTGHGRHKRRGTHARMDIIEESCS